MTYNQEEMHGLLQGLVLVKTIRVTNINILGDFLITVQHLHKGTWLRDKHLENLLKRIIQLMDEFSDFFPHPKKPKYRS